MQPHPPTVPVHPRESSAALLAEESGDYDGTYDSSLRFPGSASLRLPLGGGGGARPPLEPIGGARQNPMLAGDARGDSSDSDGRASPSRRAPWQHVVLSCCFHPCNARRGRSAAAATATCGHLARTLLRALCCYYCELSRQRNYFIDLDYGLVGSKTGEPDYGRVGCDGGTVCFLAFFDVMLCGLPAVVTNLTTRRRIRARYGIGGSACEDSVVACCFPCCAVHQQMLELEARSLSGAPPLPNMN